MTAAAWHGSKWVDERRPLELVWSNARPPRGMRTYHVRLRSEELQVVAGIPVTTPERTAYDIGRREAMGVAAKGAKKLGPTCRHPPGQLAGGEIRAAITDHHPPVHNRG